MPRFTLDTDEKFDETLAELAKLTGGTKSDVLIKAIATYRYLKTQAADAGTKVSITKDGLVLKNVEVP